MGRHAIDGISGLGQAGRGKEKSGGAQDLFGGARGSSSILGRN